MPQRKAVIYLVIAIFIVAGLIVEQSLFFNLALFLILLVLLSYGWAIASVQGLKLKRITSSLQVQVGQELVEVMQLHNTTWLPKLWLEVEDHSTLSTQQAVDHPEANLVAETTDKTGFTQTLMRAVRCVGYRDWETDRKSTRLNSSHSAKSRMPSSA